MSWSDPRSVDRTTSRYRIELRVAPSRKRSVERAYLDEALGYMLLERRLLGCSQRGYDLVLHAACGSQSLSIRSWLILLALGYRYRKKSSYTLGDPNLVANKRYPVARLVGGPRLFSQHNYRGALD